MLIECVTICQALRTVPGTWQMLCKGLLWLFLIGDSDFSMQRMGLKLKFPPHPTSPKQNIALRHSKVKFDAFPRMTPDGKDWEI